jgi:hypothetical protein
MLLPTLHTQHTLFDVFVHVLLLEDALDGLAEEEHSGLFPVKI